MPKVLRAASQTIRNLLKPAVLNNLSEDRLRNDRQSYVAMTRALVHAQLEWRDAELSSRLWEEVADRGMDRGRLIHLLYSVEAHQDEEAMQNADMAYLQLVNPKDP
ncbi:hypothetical protein FZX09_03885 [Synechococcus sp. MU1643]|uniref:hypothetical protein n=1 Tax=Synechococcus sp. MU1643 TaxID=2508349 RepID=UPI001CF901E3|nr:hypothetical protein [Synechococcus sp. MU1643]MCB4427953.1 hypothetical protein [Synechococcus sp. MU1643]